MFKKNIELFKQFLNFYWLRPESALMLTLRSMSYQKSLKFFHQNSIDVCCGDGVFSFLTFGGKLDTKTDMYQSIKLSNSLVRKDDVFDKYSKNYKTSIIKSPFFRYSYGCDWKNNLLKKASKLNLYKKLFFHNINKGFKTKNKFDFIYSNSTYWANDFEKHLNHLIEITNHGGHLVLQIKNDSILKNFVREKYYSRIFGNKFSKIIDAGRKETWKSLKSFNEINRIIKKNKNIKIIDIQPIYGNVMPHIWNFGLRPIFNPMYLMSTKLNDKDRLDAKKQFISIIYNMFENYIGNYKQKSFSGNIEIEYTYILKKIY
jgi:hypothetical protein